MRPTTPHASRAIDLDAWEVWFRERLLERDLPRVDVEVHGAHAIGQDVLDGNLTVRSRHARHPNQPGEIGDDLGRVLVDVVEELRTRPVVPRSGDVEEAKSVMISLVRVAAFAGKFSGPRAPHHSATKKALTDSLRGR